MQHGIARPELRPFPHGDRSLVTAGQLNLWLHDQRIGVGPRSVIPSAIRLRGRLDTDALNQALGDVMERHKILRTIYPSTGDRPKARRMLTQTTETQDQLSEIFDLTKWAPRT
jgi:hypothetical protein